MAENWLDDVRKYVATADETVVDKIVKYLGIALRNRDSSLVSFTDKSETDRVRENYLKKKLALTDTDAKLDAAIAKVGQRMKADRTKNRVTVYYLLAEHFGKLTVFGGTAAKPKAPKAAKPGAVKATKPAAAKPVATKATKAAATKPVAVKSAVKPAAVKATKPAAKLTAAKAAKPAAAKTAKTAKSAAAKPAKKSSDASGAAAVGAAALGAAGLAVVSTGGNSTGASAASTASASPPVTTSAATPPPASTQPAYAGGTIGSDSDAGGLGWLKWLLLLALLALAAFFLFKYCKKQDGPVGAAGDNVTAEGSLNGADSTTNGSDALANGTAAVAVPEGSGVTTEQVAGKPKLTVYFDTGKSAVHSDLTTAASGVKTYVDANAGSWLQVSGFNDPTGNAARNAELSKQRAQAVKAALEKTGIAPDRVVLVKPAETTGTTVTPNEARRVDVTINDASTPKPAN